MSVLLSAQPPPTRPRGSAVGHAKRGRIFRLRSPAVINARGADARMAQPLLDFSNVGVVLKRAGGGRGAQRVWAHVVARDAELLHIEHHDIDVYAACRERPGRLARFGCEDAPEQRPFRFKAMAGHFEVLGYQVQGAGMGGNEAQFFAFALHAKVRHAPALLAEVLHAQFGEFFPAQRAKQHHGQEGPVAFAF